jgi:hypothetical protein
MQFRKHILSLIQSRRLIQILVSLQISVAQAEKAKFVETFTFMVMAMKFTTWVTYQQT